LLLEGGTKNVAFEHVTCHRVVDTISLVEMNAYR
jgi:hypothetical protein